jgi:hypothetical protein
MYFCNINKAGIVQYGRVNTLRAGKHGLQFASRLKEVLVA